MAPFVLTVKASYTGTIGLAAAGETMTQPVEESLLHQFRAGVEAQVVLSQLVLSRAPSSNRAFSA